MSKTYQQRIFELFSREFEGYERRYDGNGLGLTLSKKYCDICDVDMEINSKKEIGTEIKLVFNNTLN